MRYNAERIWARLPEGVELDDLISAGTFGLMDAIKAFDMTRGVKFETYCVPRIRGAMLDELRTMDWVPRLVRASASKINAAVRAIEEGQQLEVTDKRLRKELDCDQKELDALRKRCPFVPGMIILNKKWFETDSYKDVCEVDILEDKKGEDPTARQQSRDRLAQFTKGLNKSERILMTLYYYEQLTMKEIGATLDLSESRVSQMHSAIIARRQKEGRLRTA